ncbi:MAG: type II secretion system protein GspK [Deltaproteobacteria bacterium]
MNDRGIVLVIVLWALLLLGTLAMSFSFAMRTEAAASRNGVDSLRAYYLARTGVERAMTRLRDFPADNEAVLAVEEGDAEEGYEARIEREGGRLDLNAVDEELLKGVLEKAGLPREEAEALGDAILDWRDGDDEPRPRGAEAPYYAGLPEPIRPRNGNFESVGELRDVRGITPEFFGGVLTRIFTVHSGSPRIDVNTAPVELLRALPGISPEAAERLITRRKESPFRSAAEISLFLGGAGVRTEALPVLSATSTSRFATILSTGRAGRAVRRIRCTVDPAAGGDGSAAIVRWEDRVDVGEEEP